MTDNREPIGTWSYVTDDQRADWSTVDEEPWPRDVDPEPYATVDLPRSGYRGPIIVWVLGAIVAAAIVAVAWLAWTR